MRRVAIALLLLVSLTVATSAEAHSSRLRASQACGGTASQRAAAQANAEGLESLTVDLFGRTETGWSIYAPMVGGEIGARCPPERPAFAAALARWQARHELPQTGVMDADTLLAMKTEWQARRPFYALRDQGACPAPPDEARLVTAKDSEMLEGSKPVRLRKRAMRAWRRMVAAARRQDRAIRADPDALKLFSGYRSPEADDARCATENNCQGLVRAACSAHRTGLAFDLNLGSAPGYTVDSTADANRLFQSKTPAYRWLVRNARRYGFVNYVFEPWHWEWTGEKP